MTEDHDPRPWSEDEALLRLLNGELKCCQCCTVSGETRSWRAYLTDDGPAAIAVYCPVCAEREFGSNAAT